MIVPPESGDQPTTTTFEEPSGASTRQVFALAVLVLIVEIVFVVSVFNPSPHTGGDNAGYLTLAYSLIERGAYLDLHDPAEPAHTKYPPVYAAVLAGAMVLGARAWTTFKALSGTFIVLAVMLTFVWVNERRGPVMATTIALLVGISDAYLWSSQWVLSDPLFIAFTLLCLWALHRAQTGVRGGGALWLAVGWSAAVLAYFTRSAGLPLLLAVAAWVALKRRWRTLAVMVVSFGIPAALWWYRGAGLGAAYISEFWFVDPYRPDLGRADAMDLVSRVYGNARMYLGTYIPGGLTGLRGTPIKILGGGLGALALVGWLRRAKAGITPAELFAPLYLGLVLLWPEVWSGDRFALPLYPFFLFYAGEALIHFVRPARPAARVAAGAAAFALVLVPAGGVWWGVSARSSACRELVQQAGPFACYGDPVLEFERAAVWSGHHLPPGSSVLTRKPRLFFVLNGIQGQAYPLTRDPEEFLDFAGRTSSSYLVLDRFDNLAAYYPARVIEERPGRFCAITGWGAAGGIRTELLGISSREDTRSERVAEDEATVTVDLRVCPPDVVVAAIVESVPSYSSTTVPLLAGLDR